MFNGQLDLIVDTIGTNVWVQKLKWSGLNQWNNARRVPLYDQGEHLPITNKTLDYNVGHIDGDLNTIS